MENESLKRSRGRERTLPLLQRLRLAMLSRLSCYIKADYYSIRVIPLKFVWHLGRRKPSITHILQSRQSFNKSHLMPKMLVKMKSYVNIYASCNNSNPYSLYSAFCFHPSHIPSHCKPYYAVYVYRLPKII